MDKNLKINSNVNWQWYALYTRPRFEKKVDSLLKEKGMESFLPLRKVRKRWSDRWKIIEEPLFSCYVFVRIPFRQRIFALQTQGVVRMVTFDGRPSPIPDEEMAAVRRLLRSEVKFEISPYCFAIGQKVEIKYGPLAGVRGQLIEKRGQKKLLVGIEQIRQGLRIEISEHEIVPVSQEKKHIQAA
ncbi:MAG: UpxY family transcription antiterminator [bacterium]